MTPVIGRQGGNLRIGHRAHHRFALAVKNRIAVRVEFLDHTALHIGGEKAEMPLAAELLHSEDGETRIEEHIELLHADLEYLGKSKMS